MRFSSFCEASLILAALTGVRTFSIGISVDEAKFQKSMTQNGCYWDGTSPFCEGGCAPGEATCSFDNCGDGECCITGTKAYCCPDQSLCPDNAKGKLEKTANDPHDDYCPPGKNILCPPGAEKNEDCKCFDKSAEGLAKDH